MDNEESIFKSLSELKDIKPSKLDNDFSISQAQSSNLHLSQLEISNNDRLMKSFKEMKEQLKESNKNCQKLRSKLNEKDSELQRLRLTEKEYVAQNYQLKNQLLQSQELLEDYQAKLNYLKESAKGTVKLQEELEYLKIEIVNYKNKLEKVMQENKQLMEITVIEKLQLEEKINKMNAKQQSDLNYVQQMEIELSKQRQKCIKLQNQLKKTQIKYDEQVYNKRWLGGNFERQQLQERISQLEKENEEATQKSKKDKEKRNELEKKIIDLEQSKGMWNIKAQTYEVENRNIMKRYKKIQKEIDACQENADNQAAQSLSWKQKFLKLVGISQQLISRVKRQLLGDVVNLAKSCQYKINKLKEEQKHFLKYTQNRKSPNPAKKKSKNRGTSKSHTPIILQIKQTPNKLIKQSNITQNSKTKPKTNYQNIKRALFVDEKESSVQTNKIQEVMSNKASQVKSNKSYASEVTPLTEIENLQVKIRRQRAEMEKKIKEKMLFRKIQVACSPEKHKLRQQYMNFIDL